MTKFEVTSINNIWDNVPGISVDVSLTVKDILSKEEKEISLTDLSSTMIPEKGDIIEL